MAATVEQAQRDLRRLARRGTTLDFGLPLAVGGAAPRQSSVLILFGALDRVPAADSTGMVAPELDVLLTRRSDRLSHHPGQIAFPGGGAEAGDASPVATALREASEETGLDSAGVTVLGTLTEALIPNSGNLVTPVLGWWHLPVTVAPDQDETVEVFRAPVADLLNPANRWTSVYRRDGYVHYGPMFLLGPHLGGHVVWGFTAMVLSTLFDELGWTAPWDGGREYLLNR